MPELDKRRVLPNPQAQQDIGLCDFKLDEFKRDVKTKTVNELLANPANQAKVDKWLEWVKTTEQPEFRGQYKAIRKNINDAKKEKHPISQLPGGALQEEQAQWCQQATQTEVDQRKEQAGLPTLHCRGILHYFSITSTVKDNQRFGLIKAQYETAKLESAPPGVLKTIIATPGKKTGAKFSIFPTKDLQGSTPTCHLWAVRTTLSTDIARIHWLVSAEPPCQRDEFNQSPFWLVEQEGGQSRVILAYRSDVIYAHTKRHQGYSLLKTHHTLDNGHNDAANITWQYDATQGQYRYLASRCSNISRMDDTEPASFEDCYKDET